MNDQMRGLMKNRWAALSLGAALTVALAAGCGPKGGDTDASNTTAPAAPTPSAPAQPGGPGGTMMNTKSTNPNGVPGDMAITAKVKNALIVDSKVAAKDINVDTKSQTVVLRGTQASPAAISAAVADAKGVKGVLKVINQLTVKK